MNIKVYKFGGASVRDAEGIRNVVHIVKESKTPNLTLWVVVSAMGKTTNALERIVAATYAGKQDEALQVLQEVRDYHEGVLKALYPVGHQFLCQKLVPFWERINSLVCAYVNLYQAGVTADYDLLYDTIVSYGELISTQIITTVLSKEGVGNERLDMTQLLITDDTHREAKVNMEESEYRLRQEMAKHNTQVFVIQGFIGGTLAGVHTTLGREGSDYTAALVANFLQAESVTIFKDVPGILNADPRLFEHTQLIPALTYTEAVELSHAGAQIIHPKTIRPLENKHIPLYVKPFEDWQATGSVIREKTLQYAEKQPNTPVYIVRKEQVLLSVRAKDFSFGLEDELQNVFEIISRNRLKVNLIQSSALTISVSVDNTRYLAAAIQELQERYKVNFNEHLTLLTLRQATENIIADALLGKDVILKQITRTTAKILYR